MKFFIYNFFILLISFTVSNNYSQETVTETEGLFWKVLKDSLTNFSKIKDYSCITTHKYLSDNSKDLKAFPDMELTHLAPDHFFVYFKDSDDHIREFVFIDGLVDRIFLYPREYKISANGEFLFNGKTLSIPHNSLLFFYDIIIPLCETNKNTLKWEFKESLKFEDIQAAKYLIKFQNPVDINGKKIGSIALTLLENNSLPREITLYDVSGTTAEEIKYSNIQLNKNIKHEFFNAKIAERRNLEGIVIENIPAIDTTQLNDPSKITDFTVNIFNLCAEKYSRIYDYSAVFIRQEKVKGTLQKPETFYIKFRKPFDLYMKWIEGPNKGWELIYASGKYNNKVIVHVSGLANVFLPTFELDPTGSIAMLNNRHSVIEFGIGYIIEKYIRDINTAVRNNELKVTYHGEDKIDNRPCWVLETQVPKGKKQYYCHRSQAYIDKEYLLPVKCTFYEWDTAKNKSEVIEVYTFTNLSINNGFTDHDFDRDNKEYKF